MARPRRRRRKIGKYGAQPTAKRTIDINAKGLKRKNQPLNAAQPESAQETGTKPAKAKQRTDKARGEVKRPVFTREDKRYLLAFLTISIAITALYWFIGGRNLFVFPAIFLLSVGTSKFWKGPVRRFAEQTAQKATEKSESKTGKTSSAS